MEGFGETYRVYGGDESAIGVYSARVSTDNAQADTTWTLTATVNGEVAWVEEGSYISSFSSENFSYTYLDDTFFGVTDLFTVAVDSVGASECYYS